MANAQKLPPNEEILAGTGTVTPNSRDKRKDLTMTGDVTLNPPAGFYPGDKYDFYVTLGGNTLTLDAAYESIRPVAPTFPEQFILHAVTRADGLIDYWISPDSPQPTIEVLASTGTVTPNDTDVIKELVMTGDVTLEPPPNLAVGDEYLFFITLGGNTLTLDPAYVSRLTTPPTILENTILHAVVTTGPQLTYWLEEAGA